MVQKDKIQKLQEQRDKLTNSGVGLFCGCKRCSNIQDKIVKIDKQIKSLALRLGTENGQK